MMEVITVREWLIMLSVLGAGLAYVCWKERLPKDDEPPEPQPFLCPLCGGSTVRTGRGWECRGCDAKSEVVS